MAIDLDTRLRSLRDRRQGRTPSTTKSLHAMDSNVLNSSLLKEEAYQRRTSELAIKYALGAMQAVDQEYTQNSYAEGDRVQQQLRDQLAGEISVDFRYQGSVPLDIHIRGISDIDLLVLRDDFHTYDSNGLAARTGRYRNPIPDTTLGRMQRLRSRCETILTNAYPAATVDTSGSKSIALSGGSLRRKIDVVPSHWHDTVAYQASADEHQRGVAILIKNEARTAENLPFVHIKRINDKDLTTWGGTKKTIRLLKNLKSDSDYTSLILLSSYDIASLVWQLPDSSLQVVNTKELSLLAAANLHLTWCATNKAEVMNLPTPDGTRKIIDSEEKFRGLQLLSFEVNQLVESVETELKKNSLFYGHTADERLRNAYIAT